MLKPYVLRLEVTSRCLDYHISTSSTITARNGGVCKLQTALFTWGIK